MKIILAGHKGSKLIIPASSWLLKKYMPKEFDVYYLNFGEYKDKLYHGLYVSLAEEQVGDRKGWAKYILKYLKTLKDKYIILGLDDFLISEKVDLKTYKKLRSLLGGNVKCARLCDVTWYPPSQYNCDEDGIVSLKTDADYTVTGQYTIWERKTLIELLRKSSDIWNFESNGSKWFAEEGYCCVAAYKQPFKYWTISALSGADLKIDLTGLNDEDREYTTSNLIKDGEIK